MFNRKGISRTRVTQQRAVSTTGRVRTGGGATVPGFDPVSAFSKLRDLEQVI